jgi:hypothetical protein
LCVVGAGQSHSGTFDGRRRVEKQVVHARENCVQAVAHISRRERPSVAEQEAAAAMPQCVRHCTALHCTALRWGKQERAD